MDQPGDMGDGFLTLADAADRLGLSRLKLREAIAKGVRRPGDAYIVLGGVELEMDNRDAAIAAYREAAKYPETENNARTWLKSAGVK